MSGPKYKHFYNLMVENNKELFEKFATVHQGFSADETAWGTQFHELGRDVKDVIRDWERRLCSGTERGNFGMYSAKLSEKFWNEVKKDFPLIDQVGLIKR